MDTAIAILGGTGAEGFGLALRWLAAGLAVRIGSREPAKAEAAAARARELVPGARVEGFENAQAAAVARTVVLTVPFAAQIPTIKAVRESLRPDAIVVDTTVPVGASVGDRLVHLVTPWAGSAAEQAAAYLPGHVAVISAFHNLAATALADLDRPVDCDVLICGDNAEAKSAVAELARQIAGVRAIDAGPLENSRFSEAVAALLIALNIRHKVKHSGARITGLFPADERLVPRGKA
jgi:8-hydroxy-5-deazaflavin:NADPH oxidoreductase